MSENKNFPLVFLNPTEHTLNLDPIGCGKVEPGEFVSVPAYLVIQNQGLFRVSVAPQLEYVLTSTEPDLDGEGDEISPLTYEEWGRYGDAFTRSPCHNSFIVWSESKGLICGRCKRPK